MSRWFYLKPEHAQVGEAKRERRGPAHSSRSASVLVGLLWCLALLSLIVIGVLHTSRLDLMVVKNYGDKVQAHYLALAGIEKAKALLYQDARDRSRSGQNHTGSLYDAPDYFREVPLGRGEFSVLHRAAADDGGDVLFGVSDEESRLNVNYTTADELTRLEDMTPDIAAAIMDWRDEDNVVTPGGAEAEYYLSLQPPYLPRNGPLQTIRELLMVRGVTPDLLYGADRHQDGMLNDGGQAGSRQVTGPYDTGWAGLMTVDSSVANLDAAGQDRVNVQTADERSLTGVRGITADIARSIIAYRAQNRFNSIADLLDVTAAQNQNQSTASTAAGNTQAQSGAPQGQETQNQPTSNRSGSKVISPDLLMDIADQLTTQTGSANLPGLININTAGVEVLQCLPGMTRELAEAIASSRRSNGFFPNIAWLLKIPGLSQDVFKQVAPRVCVRSETFRILSEGRIKSSGARQRIQEIVHVGLYDLDTLSYREDDL